MTNIFKAFHGDVNAFVGVLGQAGFTAEHLQALRMNPTLMKRWVDCLATFDEFRLIHGVYNPTSTVLANFKTWCASKEIDFNQFTWKGNQIPPQFDPNNRHKAVVLNVTLGTLQKTFEMAWEWLAQQQHDRWRWGGGLGCQASATVHR